MIYFLIADAEAPGFIRFDESLDLDWFEQLGAERMSRSYQRGQLTHIFKPAPNQHNEAMDLINKGVEPMLNPLKRDLGRDSKRLVRISMFDSFENETNCILPMMDQLFFYQRYTRPVGEMR